MIFLALRQMMSRKRQTVLILLGISLGTMMYVVISGMQLGLREYFVEKLLSSNPHVRITAPDELIQEEPTRALFYGERPVRWITPPSGKRDEARIAYPQGWFERLGADPRVVAYAPSLVANVIISRGDIKQSVVLNGIVPERQKSVTSLDTSMLAGSILDLSGGGNKMVLGSGVLEELGARVGDVLQVTVGTGEPRPFKAVGVIQFGNDQVDKSTTYAHLADVQQLNRTPGRIGEIGVKLLEMESAQLVAQEWSLGSRDRVESWQETFANLFQMFYVQDVTRWVISIAILLVAGFGVYNVLSIMITQKQREIAILRSIGYAPKKILWLFLIQGLFLGLAGALLGLFLAFFANRGISRIPLSGLREMGLSHLIVSQDPVNYGIAFGMAMASALLASLLPSLQASRLTPLDIIRGS